jgi:trimeric autotransporter adhesin
MQAIGTFSDGSTRDVTTDADWASADPIVATVTSTLLDRGRLTGASVGVTTITARIGAITATTTTSVRQLMLLALTMTPSIATVSPAGTQRFTVNALYETGIATDVTSQATWQVSPAALASISAGTATGLSAGTGTVTATWGGQTSTAQLTVSSAGVVLQSLSVVPPAVMVTTGGSTVLRVLGRYSDGSLRDVTDLATWTSNAPAIASVVGSGSLRGTVRGLMDGVALIDAALAGQHATSTVTVSTPTVVSLLVDPPTLRLGRGLTDYVEATEVLSNGDTQPVTDFATWTSSNPQLVTVTTVQGYAAITGVAPGTATVTASYGGRTATCVVVVSSATLARIDVTPLAATLPRDAYVQLSAIGVLSDQTIIDLQYLASWTSSSPGAVWVGNQGYGKGWVLAQTPGSATITVSYGGLTGTATITVTPATLNTIQVTPFAPSLPVGFETTLQATGLYSDNTTQDLTYFVSWTSSQPSLASVSSWGRLTPSMPGTAIIRATFNGVSGTTTATVTHAQLSSVALVPSMASISTQATRHFTALGVFSDGTSRDVTPWMTWLSSNRTVADVSNASGSAGDARGLTPGMITITATRQGVSGTAVLTVTP